ncbi:MAG: PIN domain-containing protein [Candidatus Nitrosocaldaceae archaeon]
MIIIDHTILLLYFAGDTRAAEVIDLINEGREEGYIYEGSMMELINKLLNVFDYQEVARRLEAIKNSKIKIIGFDYEVGKKSVKIKKMYELSMVGSYIIALAIHTGATLITADKRLLVEGLKAEYIEPPIKSHV